MSERELEKMETVGTDGEAAAKSLENGEGVSVENGESANEETETTQVENAKKAVIITTSKSSFIPNALRSALEEKGYSVVFYAVPETDLSNVKMEKRVVFLFAEEYNDVNHHLMSTVRNFLNVNGLRAVIMGQKESCEFLKMNLTVERIFAEFYRPIDVKNVVEKAEAFVSAINYQNLRKNILVVDDAGVMLRTIHSWLSDRYNVTLANSAETATMQIRKRRPDLILLDYEMPVCSGAEFLDQLRQNPITSDIPVIFLTSRSDSDTVKSVLMKRPQGYMLKTTPKEQVIEKIDKFFEDQAMKIFSTR